MSRAIVAPALLCATLLLLSPHALAGTVSYEMSGSVDMAYTEGGTRHTADGSYYIESGQPDIGTNPTIVLIEPPDGMGGKAESAFTEHPFSPSVGAKATWDVNIADYTGLNPKLDVVGNVTATSRLTTRYWFASIGGNTGFPTEMSMDFAWDGVLKGLFDELNYDGINEFTEPVATYSVSARVESEGLWYLSGGHTGFSWSFLSDGTYELDELNPEHGDPVSGTERWVQGLFSSPQNNGNSILVTLEVAATVEGAHFNLGPNGNLHLHSNFLNTLGVTGVSNNVLNAPPPQQSAVPLPASVWMGISLIAMLGIGRLRRSRT